MCYLLRVFPLLTNFPAAAWRRTTHAAGQMQSIQRFFQTYKRGWVAGRELGELHARHALSCESIKTLLQPNMLVEQTWMMLLAHASVSPH